VLPECANLEEALRLCDAQHDPKVNVSFGQDTIAAAKAFLANTTWVLGEVTQARELIEQAIARAVETAHAPTLVNAYFFKASLEALRGDADGALRAATRLIELSREHGIGPFLALGMPYFSWARARLGALETGSEELREGHRGSYGVRNQVLGPILSGTARRSRSRKAKRRTSLDAD
jgi:hypothetical protein